MLAKIAVADFMSTHLVTITPDTGVTQAIKILLDHKITSVPVVDAHGQLVGVFSEKDGVKIAVESAYNQSIPGNVAEFLSHETPVNADESLVDVAAKFQNSASRSFPAFQHGALVGMISRVDVLRALVSVK